MMVFRLTLLAVAAFGVTWAAETSLRQAVESAPVVVLAQAEPPAVEAGSADKPATTGEPQSDMSQVKLEGPSEAEMDQELARIEAAIDGEDTEDAKEFEPTKPLVADVPIDLPSDI
ncbi:MAG: hypothetical protein ACR2QB_00080 [Gammaproteobacteria bacterium]